MIILSSPTPKKHARYIHLVLATVGVVALLITGAAGFGQLREAWDAPERFALANALLQIAFGMLGMVGAAWQLAHYLIVGDPVQRLVATEHTIAIKTVRKPIIFLKRQECVALGADGKWLVMADGSKHRILAHGAKAVTTENFIDALYDLWWPGLTRAEVCKYLAVIAPPKSRWGVLPLFLVPFLILLVPTFAMWDNILVPVTLFTIALICLLTLTGTMAMRQFLAAANSRYPLMETGEEVEQREWHGAIEPSE